MSTEELESDLIAVNAVKISAEILLPILGLDSISEMKMRGHRVVINKKQFRLFKEKGTTCKLCGVKGTHFIIHKPHGGWQLTLVGFTESSRMVALTMDHIRPLAKGGSNSMENLQPMCASCNGIKADWVGIGSYKELQARLIVERSLKLKRHERKRLRSFVKTWLKPGILDKTYMRTRGRLLLMDKQ